ncbi:hypothetical protein PV729_45340 [Streptomyces europaeiscabiei]|uniref:Integral membrane protein n=1 Tax=Streptomyces europaeiscabiei TaxID=146819 RepID=A0ABU4NYC7_9ACTN|nr:hypothetical protein [Streptomyces europaeiscabiei]MDX2765648.1 hypothetical protein [Streptomyces europaeiscabiei]MDX3549726.1 hypothetical protein [Streptomyces europaeiscabiei]MDX3558800.1 hypothetical protein [Streptomyces europaeiscabiei]MDX3707264.1 hypothetical protein [Streptomyces europaeiscabiei]
MPRCAQLLLGALTLLLHQTVGIPAVLEAVAAALAWTAGEPVALLAVAVAAFWHLANHHPPQPARARH